jgi:hypothetical protein
MDATAGYLMQHDPEAERSSHGLFAEIGPRLHVWNHAAGWATVRGVVFPDWDGTERVGWGGFVRLGGEFGVDVHGAGTGGEDGIAWAGAASGKLAPLGAFVESGFQRTSSEDEYAFVTSAGLAIRLPAFAGVSLIAAEPRF